MTTSGEKQKTPTNNELAIQRTDLAAERTAMAADRSLMAWIRTALSMIGFGFTIYKFLEGLKADVPTLVMKASRPRNIGLFLIGLGTISLALAIIQYIHTFRIIKKTQEYSILRYPVIVAAILSLLGAFLFGSIIFKLI